MLGSSLRRTWIRETRLRSHPLPIAGNTDVLGGDVEDVARGQLRVGKQRSGLLAGDSLNEKQEGEGACNVHPSAKEPREHAFS
jgi:hypothetical protein